MSYINASSIPRGSASILGIGTALYLGNKSLSVAGNMISNRLAYNEGLEDNGMFGLNDLFQKYSSPFLSTYSPDDGSGESLNKSFYNYNTGISDDIDSYFNGRRASPFSIHGSWDITSGVMAAFPYQFSHVPNLMKAMLAYESTKKTYYSIASLTSTRFNGASSASSHLGIRVKGGMKFDSNSATGQIIKIADDALASAINSVKNNFAPGAFRPVGNQGTFIKKHLLYDGKEGFNKEVARLAAVNSMDDIGFRDRFVFGRTIKRLEDLGLSEEHTNELVKGMIRNQYKTTAIRSTLVDPLERRHKTVSHKLKRMMNSWKQDRRNRTNIIREGIKEGRSRVVADKAGSAYARDLNIIGKNLTDSEIGTIAKEGAESVARRLRFMRFAKFGLKAASVAPIVTGLALAGVKTAANTMHSASITLNKMTHMNFGSDDYRLNEASKSERQQAVEAIQNASLNARYLMGNEASMYH